MEWLTRSGHKAEQEPSRVDLKKGTASYGYVSKCGRCGGQGGGQQWAHTGYTCYDCGGSGRGPVKVMNLYTAEKLAKLNAAQEKRDEKARVKAAAAKVVWDEQIRQARIEFVSQNGETLNRIEANTGSDPFLADLWHKFEEYGTLSPAQLAAAERTLEQVKARAASQHVGTIGERVTFTLTVERVLSFEGHWGMSFIHLCRDAQGNKVVYRGSSKFIATGETGSVLATVKEHGEYRGEQQTEIARPKLMEVA